MRYALLLILLVMVGCDSTPEKPSEPPAVVTVEKPVAIYKPCPVTLPKRPGQCTVARDKTRAEWLQCRLSKDARLESYILELEAQLRVCVEQ